ncbi:uncharacterized protein [Diadema antillarum]|uniref:uncharacterized protein n=1 Tax=Diadema antillarum TaxID=105358 RepID=UPI003A887057
MAHFRYTRKRRSNVLLDLGWLACIFIITCLFVIVMVFYDSGDEMIYGTGPRNRQESVVWEDVGMGSREEELLKLADELETELLKSQDRISRRLEILRGRSRKGQISQDQASEARARSGVAPEQRLKRRLMDARSSRVGRGPDSGVGPASFGSSSSSSNAWGVIYRDQSSMQSVKDQESNKFRSIPETASKLASTSRLPAGRRAPSANNLINANMAPQSTNSTHQISAEGNKVHELYRTYQKEKSQRNSSELLPISKTKGLSYLLRRPQVGKSRVEDLEQDVSEISNGNVVESNGKRSHVLKIAQKTSNSKSLAWGEPSRPVVKVEAGMPLDSPLLGCRDLARVNSREHVGSGYTKRVERARLGGGDGRLVALKSVWREGKDVTACVELGMAERDCLRLASYKLLKEIALMQQLRHQNILKLPPLLASEGTILQVLSAIE